MSTLYLDCHMGAAGDMLTAALAELTGNVEQTVEKLNKIGIPGVIYSAEKMAKCGIQGTHMSVKIHGEEEESHDYRVGDVSDDHVKEEAHESEHHHHHGHSLHDIEHIVSSLHLSDKVKKDALAVYSLIAEAESTVHGKPVTDIHFHEVGTMDAIADVVAVCYLIDELHVDRIYASEVHVGSGQVKCAHGILPVPAPATGLLLKGIPTYGGEVRGELCTPTGAALLKYFVEKFGPQPAMSVQRIGYGCGKKDFEQANVVRALLGEEINSTKNTTPSDVVDESYKAGYDVELTDQIVELSCNIDDMTAEEIGFAIEELLNRGALDVFTMPIGMKKNRPGTLLTVLCKEADRDAMVRSIFALTTTIGIRTKVENRYVLDRNEVTMESEFGPVQKKVVSGYGVTREKLEYEDLARIAREKGMSLRDVRNAIEK